MSFSENVGFAEVSAVAPNLTDAAKIAAAPKMMPVITLNMVDPPRLGELGYRRGTAKARPTHRSFTVG